jgi:hypothetical protein
MTKKQKRLLTDTFWQNRLRRGSAPEGYEWLDDLLHECIQLGMLDYDTKADSLVYVDPLERPDDLRCKTKG